MKAEAWIFAICTDLLRAGHPGVLVHHRGQRPPGGDWTGTSALAMTTLLAAMVTLYLGFHAKKMDPRPEDRKDAEIADGAGELGFFPPYSWWPLWCALALGRRASSASRCGAWWLVIIGVVLGALALSGLDLRVLPRRARPLSARCGTADVADRVSASGSVGRSPFDAADRTRSRISGSPRCMSLAVRSPARRRRPAARRVAADAPATPSSPPTRRASAPRRGAAPVGVGQRRPRRAGRLGSAPTSSAAPPTCRSTRSLAVDGRRTAGSAPVTVTAPATPATLAGRDLRRRRRAGRPTTGSSRARRTPWSDRPGRRTASRSRAASRFTTQDLTLDQQTYPSVAPLAGETVGVGMPVIVTFDVPVTDRARSRST